MTLFKVPGIPNFSTARVVFATLIYFVLFISVAWNCPRNLPIRFSVTISPSLFSGCSMKSEEESNAGVAQWNEKSEGLEQWQRRKEEETYQRQRNGQPARDHIVTLKLRVALYISKALRPFEKASMKVGKGKAKAPFLD